MITRRFGFKHQTNAGGWQKTRGGSYLAGTSGAPAYPPQGALYRHNAAPALGMCKPNLMMDPSDPSTWQRPYRFTI